MLRRRIGFFLVNRVFAGTRKSFFGIKRKLLRFAGFNIGKGTKIVGPIICTGNVQIGKNCWIGKNFTINGNGMVIIGDNVDIAPDVTFNTGGMRLETQSVELVKDIIIRKRLAMVVGYALALLL